MNDFTIKPVEVAPVEAPQTWTATGAKPEPFAQALNAAAGVARILFGNEALEKMEPEEYKAKIVQLSEFAAGVTLAAMRKAGVRPDLPVEATFDESTEGADA